MTTIRVEREVRDQLAALADANGRSLGAELASILDDLRWLAIRDGYQRLAERPDEMAAYQLEAETLGFADLAHLAVTAAEEYPEYNGGIG